MTILEACQEFSKILKLSSPNIESRVYEFEKGFSCAIDYKDSLLEKELSKQNLGESAIDNVKGTVKIPKFGNIRLEIPINFYGRGKDTRFEKINLVDCTLHNIHIHTKEKSAHLHLECDKSAKKEVTNIIRDMNIASRLAAGMKPYED